MYTFQLAEKGGHHFVGKIEGLSSLYFVVETLLMNFNGDTVAPLNLDVTILSKPGRDQNMQSEKIVAPRCVYAVVVVSFALI